jgi:hypothetical protein
LCVYNQNQAAIPSSSKPEILENLRKMIAAIGSNVKTE